MSAAVTGVVAARIPERSWRSEARAVKVVARRELQRFFGNRAQMLMWGIQPLLFLFVLGAGLQSLSEASTHGVDLKTFMFPGVLCITVVFTGMLSAASLVWDRELGFLNELLVAPVSRTSILLGKCLGGALIATLQAVVVLALAALVDVPYDPLLILGALALVMLLALTITSFGLLIAVSIKQAQTFTSTMQLLIVPMYFVSGALYPVSGLPAWLGVLNRIDPITYAVDPMRRLVFSYLDVSPAARATLDPGVTWLGWRVPTALEVAMLAALGVGMMALAIARFARTE
jgi:ABC-2 type transport system permease protein